VANDVTFCKDCNVETNNIGQCDECHKLSLDVWTLSQLDKCNSNPTQKEELMSKVTAKKATQATAKAKNAKTKAAVKAGTTASTVKVEKPAKAKVEKVVTPKAAKVKVEKPAKVVTPKAEKQPKAPKEPKAPADRSKGRNMRNGSASKSAQVRDILLSMNNKPFDEVFNTVNGAVEFNSTQLCKRYILNNAAKLADFTFAKAEATPAV